MVLWKMKSCQQGVWWLSVPGSWVPDVTIHRFVLWSISRLKGKLQLSQSLSQSCLTKPVINNFLLIFVALKICLMIILVHKFRVTTQSEKPWIKQDEIWCSVTWYYMPLGWHQADHRHGPQLTPHPPAPWLSSPVTSFWIMTALIHITWWNVC